MRGQRPKSSSSFLGEDRERSKARTEAPASDLRTRSKIVGGIEWYTVDAGPVERDDFDDCQCARCGSSVTFVECYECGGEGIVEEDDDEDFGNETHLRRCPLCWGKCGYWHCISTPEYCEANPLQGRETIKSTAMGREWWNDNL